MVEKAIEKADTLIEALGWIRRFRGKVTVIKLGGSVMEDANELRHVLIDIVFIGLGIAGLALSPDRHLLTGQMWFRTSTEFLGMITGLVSGIALAYESGAFAEQQVPSFEGMI